MEEIKSKHEAQSDVLGPLDQQAPIVPLVAVNSEGTGGSVTHTPVKAEPMALVSEPGAIKVEPAHVAVAEAKQETTAEMKQQAAAEVKQETLVKREAPPDDSEEGDEEEELEELEEDAMEDVEEEEMQEGAWKQLLYCALGACAPPSRFACSGRLEDKAPFLCPDITVGGVGRLGLPLSREQAATLKSVAEQAPHGKGLRTVVDTAVRDAFQVDASKVQIAGSWESVLQSAVEEVAQALDISHSANVNNLEARLYKLLLYEQGGHFSAHQDTEKEKGMIGTLVVQLPCCEGHTGGTLVVRHKGVQYKHDFSQDSATSMQYVAFFADCEHELTPLASGMRLVLTYNLVFTGPSAAAPRLVGRSPAEVQLQQALQAWEKELAAGSEQKRIAFLLEHEYTESNLSFKHLKGSDRAMVRALSSCPGFDAHLVLVTRTVSGSTDSPGWGYKRCRYYDDYDDEYRGKGEHTICDVHEDMTDTGMWIAMDGSSINYGAIDPETDFYDPDGEPLFGDDDDPDSENYEGFTGNAGPTLDQIYRKVLLVIWPRSQTLANARRAGLQALLAVLRIRMKEVKQLQHSSTGSDESNSSTPTEQQQGDGTPNGAGSNSNSSSSSRLKKAAAEVVAALQACAQLADRLLQTSAPTSNISAYRPYAYGHSSAASQQAADVLSLGAKAVRLGIAGAVKPLMQLLLSVGKSPAGLSDEKMAPAVAAAAHVMDAEAVMPALRQLVMQQMPTQPVRCISLIRKMVSQPELQQLLASAAVEAAPVTLVEHLISLAVALTGLPEVQQAAIAKAAAAVRADISAGTAEKVTSLLTQLQSLPALQEQLAFAAAAALCSAGPMQHCNSVAQLLQVCQGQQQVVEQVVGSLCSAVCISMMPWQVGGLMQLLQALEALPAARQAVLAAAMQGMFGCNNAVSVGISNMLLSNQTEDSLLQLSQLLLTQAELAEAYYGRFATAVMARRDTYPLLKKLLQTESVQSALGRPAVQQLVACQVANLQRKSAAPPFSWHMKEARLPSYPQVEAFLHGPQETFTLRGFSSIVQARSAASSLLNSRYPYAYSGQGSYVSSNYSITAQAHGTGRNAYVAIRKTRQCYELMVEAKQEFVKELQGVKALQRSLPGVAGGAAGVSTSRTAPGAAAAATARSAPGAAAMPAPRTAVGVAGVPTAPTTVQRVVECISLIDDE